nr:MAG TPA: hypothetical protein [Caudoviricetes sp.]
MTTKEIYELSGEINDRLGDYRHDTATNTQDGRRSFIYLGVEYAITAC